MTLAAVVETDTPVERRAAERRAFQKITSRLVEAANNGELDALTRRHALETNRLFWSVLKDNVFSEENRLTIDVKGQIVTLATWVEGYTDRVLRGESAEIRPLISINDTVMEGLA